MMKVSDLKKLMLQSLDLNSDPVNTSRQLNEEIVNYDFGDSFTGKVMSALNEHQLTNMREIEFSRYLVLAFSRIAITGIAAIILLLISIFLMEGSLSPDSIIGLGGSYDEDIIYLLTGIN
jgi:hypothetical protein